MEKVIDMCKRVEGHGNVKIFIKNEKISNINFQLNIFRGFEKILKQKILIDIPRIASRICGLCHASQNIVSCKAIESIYNISPHENTILLRRILMIGELIKSHSLHLFFQSLPDLLYISKNLPNIPSLPELSQFDNQLTNKFFELIKIGNDIDRLFGGRAIHLITNIPGGHFLQNSEKNIKIARKYFQKALENINYIIEKFINLFKKLTPPKLFQIPNPIFMSLHNNESFDRYDGDLIINYNNENKIEFLLENYSKYFNKDPELPGINFSNEEIVVVGPISRYNIMKNSISEELKARINHFSNAWEKSILFSNFLKLIEMNIEVNQGIEIINNPILKKKSVPLILKNIQKLNGFGVVEAPRGILIHHYKLNENHKIEDIKLFVATEINIPIINEMLLKFSKDLYDMTGDIELIKQKAQMVIRAFDPCISCATH